MSNERHSRIEQWAREIWEREGRPHGRAEAHWRQAEADTERESPSSDPDAGPVGPAPLTSVAPAEGAPDIEPKPSRGKAKPS